MDKKKSKYKNDYSLRTLAYYQREGGVYNELITILQRIRAERGNGRLLSPAKVLNKACEMADFIVDFATNPLNGNVVDPGFVTEYRYDDSHYVGGDGILDEYERGDRTLILCSLIVLLARTPEFRNETIPAILYIVEQEKLYTHFHSLVEKLLRDNPSEVEVLKKQIASKEKIINQKDSQIAELTRHITEIESSLRRNGFKERRQSFWEEHAKNFYEQKNQLPENSSGVTSDFNMHLTLEVILEWIKQRQHYALSEHVFAMLKDLSRNTATDEEYDKIQSLQNELIAKYTPHSIINNNMGIGSNILTGITSNPMMPMGYDQDQIMQKFIEFLNNGARRENKD